MKASNVLIWKIWNPEKVLFLWESQPLSLYSTVLTIGLLAKSRLPLKCFFRSFLTDCAACMKGNLVRNRLNLALVLNASIKSSPLDNCYSINSIFKSQQ